MAGIAKLAAVNICLRAIAQDPIISGPPSASPTEDENAAVDFIDNAVEQLILRKEPFYSVSGNPNTTFEKTLTANGLGKVSLATDGTIIRNDVLRARLHPDDQYFYTKEVVERIDPADDVLRLYSVTDESFTIWGANTQVKVTLTYSDAFEDLPPAARWWVTMRAAADTVTSRGQASISKIQTWEAKAMSAWHDLQRDETLRQPATAFDNYNAMRPINRPTMYVGP